MDIRSELLSMAQTLRKNRVRIEQVGEYYQVDGPPPAIYSYSTDIIDLYPILYTFGNGLYFGAELWSMNGENFHSMEKFCDYIVSRKK